MRSGAIQRPAKAGYGAFALHLKTRYLTELKNENNVGAYRIYLGDMVRRIQLMNAPLPAPPPLFRSERFDLRKLHYFLRIVELGSISRAALELRIAQPALSKSIRCLEFDLRTSLLERSSKGVQPTRAGEKLYQHCRIVFRQLELARAEVEGTGEVPSGSVTVGIPYSVNLILAAPLLRETLHRFPEIDLQIVEEHSAGVGQHLLSNRIDIGIMVSEGEMNSAIDAEPIVQEDFLLVRPSNGSLSDEHEMVRLEDVVDQPIILAKGQLRTMVEERFARRLLRLSAVREIETFSMIPQCVEAGIGAAILPAGWISASRSTRTMWSRFQGDTMNRRLAICQSSSRRLSYAAICVKRLAQQITAGLVAGGQWQTARLIQNA
jgi:LysR family transcriptional regulator, nitrogen assimilation regulatory protein